MNGYCEVLKLISEKIASVLVLELNQSSEWGRSLSEIKSAPWRLLAGVWHKKISLR